MEITDHTAATSVRPTPRPLAALLSRWSVALGCADLLALALTGLLNRTLDPALLAIFLVAVPIVFAIAGLYTNRIRLSTLDHAPVAIGAMTLAATAVVTVNFMVLRHPLDPAAVVRLWATAAITLPLARLAVAPLRKIAVKVAPQRKAIIVGSGTSATLVAKKLERHPELGLSLVGFVDDGPRKSVRGRHEPLLGDLDRLGQIISESQAEVVIVAFVRNHYEQILGALYRSEPKVEILIMPRYFEFLSAGLQVDDVAGMPILRMNRRVYSRTKEAFKRLEDIVLGTVLLAIVLPFFPLIALAIRLDSPGPTFYRSRRMGRDFKPFSVYKFRSMRVGADQDTETEKKLRGANPEGLKNAVADVRVTRVGRILRKTSIDELPQLFNVLKGDMSLVGPRPLHPDETASYTEWQKKTLSVRPGLTCIWQVSGRSDLPFDEKVWLDFMYMDTWSPWLDLRILLQTVIAVVTTRGAY